MSTPPPPPPPPLRPALAPLGPSSGPTSGAALGPRVALPRPPTPWGTALGGIWRSRTALPVPVLVSAAVAGVAGGALLVDHRPGLGAGLVALAAWLPAAALLLRRRAWLDLVTATGALALVETVVLRDAGWVVGVATATGLIAMAVAVSGGSAARAVLLSPIAGAIAGLRTAPVLGSAGVRAAGQRRGSLLRGLRSAALTLAVILVFGGLFASADAVFASLVPEVRLGLLPAQLVVGALVAFATAAVAHLALAPPTWPSADALPVRRPAPLGEWLAPVAALDLLVVAFLGVQVGGLVAGHAYVQTATGLTYAQYARSGFGQLVAATALTLVVVGVAAHRAPRDTARERLATTAALGVLTVGTLGVVASALRRMALYVDAYGLTELRLLVLVAELVLGTLLALVLAAGVRWRARWLPRAAVLAVMAGVGGLVLVNPDALIVRYDAQADAPLDVVYLSRLSADAVPAMATLDEPLRTCLLTLAAGAHQPDGSPVSWNLGRARADVALADVPRAHGGLAYEEACRAVG